VPQFGSWRGPSPTLSPFPLVTTRPGSRMRRRCWPRSRCCERTSGRSSTGFPASCRSCSIPGPPRSPSLSPGFRSPAGRPPRRAGATTPAGSGRTSSTCSPLPPWNAAPRRSPDLARRFC
jgi:hypothetical protein